MAEAAAAPALSAALAAALWPARLAEGAVGPCGSRRGIGGCYPAATWPRTLKGCAAAGRKQEAALRRQGAMRSGRTATARDGVRVRACCARPLEVLLPGMFKEWEERLQHFSCTAVKN